MAALALIRVLADNDGWDMHGGGWWAPMMIAMPLFWGAVILCFVWLARGGFERRQRPSEETALAVLDRRLAEGALSPDDYRQRKNILTGVATPRPDQDVGSPAIGGGQK